MIRDNRVLIVSGATGSGKSTQIPQFILQDGLDTGKECNVCSNVNIRSSVLNLGVYQRSLFARELVMKCAVIDWSDTRLEGRTNSLEIPDYVL
jgi:predicted kinase